MPEAPYAELDYKKNLKLDLFPTIWCPGCGIGTIMMQLAMVLDEMAMDESNTIVVTGIGCTGRMGGYMKYESVYTLHGRTLPVAEAIKTVRPEMHVIVVAGDGDTASIGGNHLIHAIRRNAHLTVLCNNNEIYGLTGGQTGPTTPTGTKTLSSPAGNPNTPINLQGLVRSSSHALYAKTTVYHQQHMRNVIREAIEHPGFAFVDITSQCIENNGRRIGFASANDMLTFYRKTYKRAAKGAEHLNPFEIGVLYPRTDGAAETNGNGAGMTAGPRATGRAARAACRTDDGRGRAGRHRRTHDRWWRRREGAQARRVAGARGADGAALAGGEAAGGEEGADPDRSPDRGRPGGARVAAHRGQRAGPGAGCPGEVEISATGADPKTQDQPGDLAAQAVETVAESVAETPVDPKEAKRAEAQRKLALMQRLPSELKLRVAKREISLEDALREAGVDQE